MEYILLVRKKKTEMQICIEESNFASLCNTWVDSKNFVSPFASFSTVDRKVCGFITLSETIKNSVFRSFPMGSLRGRESEKGKEKGGRCGRIDKGVEAILPLTAPPPPRDTLRREIVGWRLKVKVELFPARANLESFGLHT